MVLSRRKFMQAAVVAIALTTGLARTRIEMSPLTDGIELPPGTRAIFAGEDMDFQWRMTTNEWTEEYKVVTLALKADSVVPIGMPPVANRNILNAATIVVPGLIAMS